MSEVKRNKHYVRRSKRPQPEYSKSAYDGKTLRWEWKYETELGIYEQYRAAGILNQRMMRETYPWLRILDNATAEGRRNLRMMNPSLDQFLLKWGYVSAAMNPMHTGKTLQEIMDMSNEVTIDWNMSLVN